MAAKKLLVADDSLTIQKVIRLALSGAAAAGSSHDGYNIQAVSDGNDAIQQISLFRPDIVLVDVSLPGKTAFEVKRAINEHADLSAIRFILMSSAFEKVDEEQAREVVFHGRLTKPFDPAHLREVLAQVITQLQDKSSGGPRNTQNEPTVFLNTAPGGPLAEAAGPPPFPRSESFELPPAPEPPPLSASLPFEAPPELTLPPPPTFDAENDFQEHTGFLPSPARTERGLEPMIPALPSTEGRPELSGAYESDIRELTETTMKMGMLDESGWSVQEHLLKPPAQLADVGNSSFPISPPPPLPQPPSRVDGTGPHSRTELARQSALVAESPRPWVPADPISSSLSPEPEPEPEPPTPLSAVPQEPAFSTEQVREAIRDEVTEALGKMVQDLLPELAERIIKQEIRRMLSDQP